MDESIASRLESLAFHAGGAGGPMAELTAEQFGQRAFEMDLLDQRQLESIWSQFGTRDVPMADFRTLLLRRELLTNFQVERLLRGDRSGYFYGDYKVLYRVGTGTFARVYRAVHKETGKVVAVKVLRRRFIEDPDVKAQFLHEGEVGEKLRHPNIVPVYEVRSQRDSHYMIMEFLEGRSLREFVKIRKRLDPVEATRLMTEVAAGLNYAFGKGICHRDMKMSNILVSARGEAKLLDFGLAGAADAMTDEALANCPNPRTIDYAGLERATGVRKDDLRSDIYFAGGIYYHMLSGHPALVETTDRIQRLSITRFQEVVPLAQRAPSLPHIVVAVVNKAMELDVKRRYQTPREMLADLKLVAKRLAGAGNKQGADGGAPVELEGKGRTVMVVEKFPVLQNALRDQLKKHGYRVLVIGDPDRAMDRFLDANCRVDCIILSTHALGDVALDAFNRIGDFARTKSVPAVLLMGEKQGGYKERAKLADHRVAVAMPIRMKQFRGILKKLIAEKG